MLRHFITAEQLLALRRWYSAKQMAEIYRIKWDAMRQRLSYYGIVRVKNGNGDELVRKLWSKGYPEDIADYMALPLWVVERICVRLGLRQLTLWPLREIKAEAVKPERRLTIAHRAPRVSCTQLDLFDQLNQMSIAA